MKISHRTATLTVFLALTVLVMHCSSTGPVTSETEFTKLLRETGMVFTTPDGFKATPVLKNNAGVKYQHAMKHKKKKLEIRYSIFSLKKILTEYKKKLSKGIVERDPNTTFIELTQAISDRIRESGGIRKVGANETVVRKYKADTITSAMMEPKSGFGKGYSTLMMVGMRKDDKSFAYIFYLFDEYDEVQREIVKSMFSMGYK